MFHYYKINSIKFNSIKIPKNHREGGCSNIKGKVKTLKEWLPIEQVYRNGLVKTSKNTYIKIIKVIPINYNLKSDLEKNAILNSYKTFLKTCNFNIQIIIQSNKENLEEHIKDIEKNIEKKEKKYLKEIAQNYIENIKNINNSKKSSTKEFYIIIENEKIENEKYNNEKEIIENDLKEKYFKIKECLSRCGNQCIEINSKKEILEIYTQFLNTRKKLNY